MLNPETVRTDETMARHSDHRQVYLSLLTPQLPRMLSLLDREPNSLSYGSFDRDHWAWKFRDFPITMAQGAMYPLALLLAYDFPGNPFYQNAQIREWIYGAVTRTLTRQHRNGAFDSVGPYTQDHGVTLAMVYYLSEVARTLGEALPHDLRQKVAQGIQRGCQFALHSDEDYAFISNHQALFAVAYHNAFEILANELYLDQAERIIKRILEKQSADGWYLEYDGPDPGYESLGIFYLAVYWQRTGSASVLASLRRCLEFYRYFVHPDGSVGGNYGSRHTSLYFPGGFEILAPELPDAAAVAGFMRQRLTEHNVVTPLQVDDENLPVLGYAYLVASMAAEKARMAATSSLPCEIERVTHSFPESGLWVKGTRSYYAIVSHAKGGVVRAFDKVTQKVAYEDAGYLLYTDARVLASQLIGLGRWKDDRNRDQVTCTTNFARTRQELLTPAKFVLLRILNLTVFRSKLLGGVIRRIIIRRLIQDRHVSQASLTRTIGFTDGEIRFVDQIELDENLVVKRVSLPRSYTAIHMGSAKYFHPSELVSMPQVDLSDVPARLSQRRSAQIKFAVAFSGFGPPEFTVELPDSAVG